MARLSVAITAATAGFEAGITRIVTASRAGAAKVERAWATAGRGFDATSRGMASAGRALGGIADAGSVAAGKVAAASARVDAAMAAEAKATRAVSLAQARLNEVRASSGASAARNLAAEHSLMNAEAAHAAAAKATRGATEQLAAAQAQAATGAGRFGAAMDSVAGRREKLNQLSGSLLKVGAVGAVGFGLLAKAAIDWESEWIGVTKTVDFGTGSFDQINAKMAATEDGLRGLTRTLPSSHKEIADVAQELGAMGVGSDNLVKFTKVALQLGDTTNMSATEAAQGLAQLIVVSGESLDSVEKLGSAVVDLGVHSNATEKPILDMALRMASAGRQAGMSAADILGIGAALASTGIKAEAGGNQMGVSINKINTIVGNGGDKLAEFAKVAGMSSQQFADAWRKDPAEALTGFIEGLGKMQAAGQNVDAWLKSHGIVNIREVRNIENLANAHGLLRESIDRSRGAVEKGSELNELASKRYQSSASRIKIAWNNISDAAITAGADILPVVSQIADSIAGMARGFGEMDPHLQHTILSFAGIATGALLLGGGLVKAITWIATINSALGTLATRAPLAASGLKALGLAGLALAVVIPILGYFKDKMDAINQLEKTPGATGSTLVQLGNNAAGAKDKLNQLFTVTDAWKKGSNVFEQNVDGVGQAFERVFNRDIPTKRIDQFDAFMEHLGGSKDTFALLKEEVDKTDKSLGEMVSGGSIKQAGQDVRVITNEWDKASVALGHGHISMQDVIAQLPTYRDELIKVAEAHGLANPTIEQLAEIASGKLPGGLNMSKEETKKLATALGLVPEPAKKAAQSLEDLRKQALDAAQAYTTAMDQMRGANIDTESSFLDAIDAIKKNGKAWDFTEQSTTKHKRAALANRKAVNDQSTAILGNIQAMFQAGASQQALNSANKEGIRQFRALATAAGAPKPYIDALIAAEFKVPKQVKTTIATAGAHLSETEATQVNNAIRGIPEEWRSKIIGTAETKGWVEAKHLIDIIKGKTVEVKVEGAIKSKTQANDLNRDIGKLPKEVRPKIRTIAYLQGYKAAHEAIEREKTHHAEPKIRTVYNPAGVQQAENSLNGLPNSKTVTITTRHVNEFITTTAPSGRVVRVKDPGAAEGGYIAGPGGPTEDAIPAWLSNGEFVLRAAAVASLGVARLNRLNATGHFAGGGLARTRFATGGAVTGQVDLALIMRLIKALVDPVAVIRNASRVAILAKQAADAAARDVRRPKAVLDAATRAYDQARLRAAGQRERIARLQAAASGAEKTQQQRIAELQTSSSRSIAAQQARIAELQKRASATKGYTSADRAVQQARADLARTRASGSNTRALQQARAELAAIRSSGSAERSLRGAHIDLARANTEVTRTSQAKSKATDAYNKAAQRSKDLTEKLKAANDALREAQQALADQAKQMSNTLAEPYRSASHDIDDWLIAMKTGTVDLAKLNGEVARLRKLGLNETLVQQIVSQGGIVGGELADQVLKGGMKLVASLNAANAGLQKAADNLGLTQASGPQRAATGGFITGPGNGISDSIPARLSNGEYVVNAMATTAYRPWLDAINYTHTQTRDYLPHYATGGYVWRRPAVPSKEIRAGDVNFNGTINVIDPDQLLRKAKTRQRDAMVMAGLSVAV